MKVREGDSKRTTVAQGVEENEIHRVAQRNKVGSSPRGLFCLIKIDIFRLPRVEVFDLLSDSDCGLRLADAGKRRSDLVHLLQSNFVSLNPLMFVNSL